MSTKPGAIQGHDHIATKKYDKEVRDVQYSGAISDPGWFLYDGTGDFLNRRPGSAISIGLLHNATPVLGVVYAPVTPSGPDCIAWAEGAPALLRNGRPVNNDLQSAILGKRPAKSPSELQH